MLDRRAVLAAAAIGLSTPPHADAATVSLPRGRRRETLAADGERSSRQNSVCVKTRRYWIMPDVGHFLMLERPDALNDILAAELLAFHDVARPA